MKKVLLSLLSIFTVLFFISCGSKPAPEETKPEAPVVEETTTENEVSEEVTPEETVDEDAYAAMIAKIEDARKAAIEAGADEKAPDLLKQIDDLYESLKNSDLENNVDLIIARYKLLADYLKATDAKQEIDDNEFAFYAQKDYDEGVEYLAKVEAALGNPDQLDSSVYSAAEKAYSSFNKVLIVAYKRLAKEERENAYEAKKKADSVKAGVAQKARYKAAADDFQTGDSLYAMQSPKKALDKYVSAGEQFTELFEDVSEQRAAAQAAIDAAKKRVAESKSYAEDADAKSPITEQVDGIEDEDAVLLEEDEYENPEEAEVDIAESIDDESEDEADVDAEAEEDTETEEEEE